MAPETPEKDPRELNARLRELLAIPERQRTDAQWDEIIEIEISQGPKKPSANNTYNTPYNTRSDAQDPNKRAQGKRPGNKPVMPGKHVRKHRPAGPGKA
ncbi:hypothetical protein GALL_240660 [mine drainage metagenome]|uniref:Uncharacterized protein n=1 Tax=mine drainage metagenome TaxID=410659 RepID=A0A1J5RWW6_9ZZZZ